MENILRKLFVKLKDAMDEMFEMKTKGHVGDVKQSAAALLFVPLKHSNREVKRQIKSGRDELQAEKSKVDLSRLQLQNLLYEVSHLKKEIIRCQKFESRDKFLELLSDKEYAIKFTDKDDHDKLSKHKTHLYRLDCELRLRKDLDNQYSVLMNSKKQLMEQNRRQTLRYLSFGPALRTLQESTKPLHDALQLNLDVEWKLSAIVKYLPRPLYILFINLQSLQRIKDEYSFSSEVVGYESDIQMQELLSCNSDESPPKERRNFSDDVNMPTGNTVDNSLERALKPHPLHLRVVMDSPDKSNELVLTIRYWELLKCVTLRAQCDSNNINGQGDTNFIQDLFSHLYANDFGNCVPVPGIQYELQNFNFNEGECMKYLVNNGYGKPYCWLQGMCSVATVNEQKRYNHELKLHKWTRAVFDRISKRWRSWLRLTQQLRGLTYKEIDMYTLRENIYPDGLSSSLVQWSVITTEEFNIQNSDLLNNLTDDNSITYTSYRAVIVRGSAKMECFIRIPSNYPLETPLWILSVHWNGQHTSMNNSAIKMMECWTNTLRPQHLEKEDRLLYSQLFRTICSFDIFLETEGSMQATREYNKEKPYISAFTKRIRFRPYKFIKKGSIFTFKQ
ncbi:THO complex subunit 5 isoform X2 [Drosophila busckii]|uniref:THO complex subunit 5 isoform X2 n=1 Tax=Drosophila busckii TaxID=30019 RepID=UPI00083F24C4|nr:THO complex subunit 5 isoform X2 [Drosophila busckii]